ncbi:alpha/beta hydrolase-fold protein [Streptomyces sp. G-G2]|uniref:alpha/beta hydrolase n=1 Tax=Streptomyces sp. G-G2 TaxID=3046201 RepID=UPI0024B9F3C7|nr:alpha/beta hydrolase-fold protein [Streptomyces sp. G-G2]MDJ0381146.1 alpha/beta hydrolase-fold protein [Streptomyces sp. G-G2]
MTYRTQPQPQPPQTRPPSGQAPPKRSRRAWAAGASALVIAGVAAGCALSDADVFSDTGDVIRFDQDQDQNREQGQDQGRATAQPGTPAHAPADPLTRMPMGPRPELRIAATIPEDGSKVMVTTLAGKKSGFTGKVWLWVPPQYKEPRYARSGFPVLIALPGGPGYPDNYWMDKNLKLESSVSKWSKEGSSLPFILAMPVLNPQTDAGGLYWDGSDIPGQPKMGTWLTEDVPDLVRATFRTIGSRDGWGFLGNSTGAFAGLKAVLQKPDEFKAVIANGPDIVPDSRLWNGHPQEKAENSPPQLAQQILDHDGPEVYLGFQVGTTGTDVRTRPPIERFIAEYGTGPVKTRLSVNQGGGHSAYSYVPGMYGGGLIQWISRHMRGPVPSP